MQNQFESGDTARMFIALELPQVIREMIGEWGEKMLLDPALRPVPVESLHLTLAFLGERPLADVERIERIIVELAETPIMLELEGPVVRPEQGSPRFVALPTSSNPVLARGGELAEILACEGLYSPPERPFWPHVTVARVRAGAGAPVLQDVLAGTPPTAGYGWFDAVRVSLYRSTLHPEGSSYVPLAQVELPGRGWQ